MKKAVLSDIAKHVGVSAALVSYVLNGLAEEKQVNKKTAEKIKKAAKKLNYLPNEIAKSLKTSKTFTIGLIVAEIKYHYSTEIIPVIEAEARKYNYTVIYGSSNENEKKFKELINIFVNRRVDGLILAPVENSQSQIRHLKKSGIPFILIDRFFPEIKTTNIALENYKASYQATEYLIRSRHKRIAMIIYKTTLHHLKERIRGYFNALKDFKIPADDELLQQIAASNSIEGIHSAIDNIINFTKPCDAIFFATANLALHGLAYMNQKGIKVPEDISVFSFDESEAFKLFYCPITYTRQPLTAMGIRAVQSLISLITKDKKIDKEITFDAELITGKSCNEN